MKLALLLSVLLSLPSFATSLRVNGQAGVNQKNEFFACRYVSNQKNEIRNQKRECIDMVLNQAQTVEPGLYFIAYSNSGFIQQVNDGDAVTVNLIQLKLPAINGPKFFKVFRDITQTEELEKVALFEWGHLRSYRILDTSKFKGDEWDKDTWETNCYREPEKTKNCVFLNFNEAQLCSRTTSKDAKAVCDARASTDFRNLIGPYFKSNPDATMTYLSVDYSYDQKTKTMSENTAETKWKSTSRVYVGDKASIDWGWISVLPGTYGVELSDETGATMVRYGISAH